MTTEIIINVTLGETRIARLENDAVVELSIERTHDASLVGNIYKGKVVRVLPGMQAAFVNLGLDRTAFIHASDVVEEMAHLDTFLNVADALIEDSLAKTVDITTEKFRPTRRKKESIQKILKEGNEILVQIAKEPMGTKGARLTSHISLPGRYLVYMPTVDHIGISHRIADDKERKRLKEIVERFKPQNGGFIVRTASEGMSQKELKSDIEYLTRMWQGIEEKASKAKPPALIHSELPPIMRSIRDLFTTDVDRLVIDSKDEYNKIKKFVSKFMPSVKGKIEFHDRAEPIFDAFGIEIEITRALGQKVWLKSGGYIIIEQTEALTAIDVNTGRFVGRRDLEDTILKTNLEAMKEIVYQLRLRNIGGIIILDFIDMEKKANRDKVYSALVSALSSDKAKTVVTKISDLGLVEMTRKRTREDIRMFLTNPCFYCEGKGYLKSPTTVCFEIFREVKREAPGFKGKQIVIHAHPNVVNTMYDEERSWLEELEHAYKRRIILKAESSYHLEQFDVAVL
ncbi:Rne/Rng family ribonuclease [bacterium]|nr:Rne/Rng family ribonuclease [bacterium]